MEIRVPGNLNLKWLVPVYQLQGHSLAEYEELHKDCFGDYCYGLDVEPCPMYMVTPGMVRKYIDEMRQVTA